MDALTAASEIFLVEGFRDAVRVLRGEEGKGGSPIEDEWTQDRAIKHLLPPEGKVHSSEALDTSEGIHMDKLMPGGWGIVRDSAKSRLKFSVPYVMRRLRASALVTGKADSGRALIPCKAGAGSKVYLAGVCEFVAAEVLEIAGMAALDRGSPVVAVGDVLLALFKDEHFRAFVSQNEPLHRVLEAHAAAVLQGPPKEAPPTEALCAAEAEAVAAVSRKPFQPTLAPHASQARRGDPGPTEVPSFCALVADGRTMRGLLKGARKRAAGEAGAEGAGEGGGGGGGGGGGEAILSAAAAAAMIVEPSPGLAALERALELMKAYETEAHAHFAHLHPPPEPSSTSRGRSGALKPQPTPGPAPSLQRSLCLPAPLLVFLRLAMESCEVELSRLQGPRGLLRCADAPALALGPLHAPWEADKLPLEEAEAAVLQDVMRLFAPEPGPGPRLAKFLRAEE